MLDERWTSEVADVAAALRSLLAAKCNEATIREVEASHIGWSPEVQEHLRSFGLFELPGEPELLATVAYELGRSLAPVPWPEMASVKAVLSLDAAGYAFETDAPLGPSHAVVRTIGGAGLVTNDGPLGRTGGGDILVGIDRSRAEQRWDRNQADQLAALMRLLAAARLVGAAGRLVEIGVEYAKTRHAFGRPIGSYQAVSHKLADAATAVEGAELLVRKASLVASRHGGGVAPPAHFGLMVWSNAVEAGRQVARSVHQCMGGFGATLEYPAQLYSRRIRSWALRLGRPGDGYRDVGRMVLDADRRDSLAGLWHHERGITIPRWARELDRLPKS